MQLKRIGQYATVAPGYIYARVCKIKHFASTAIRVSGSLMATTSVAATTIRVSGSLTSIALNTYACAYVRTYEQEFSRKFPWMKSGKNKTKIRAETEYSKNMFQNPCCKTKL